MDVERTIEFILEQQAHAAAIRAQHEADMARHQSDIARHEGEIARLDAQLRQVDIRLRRAIRLAVQEARNERKRRQELDARFDLKMDRIASAQLLNEEMIRKLGDKIDKFVDGLRQPGGNGGRQ